MPRTPKAKPNSIVASAARVVQRRGTAGRATPGVEAWQGDAYYYLSTTGELSYAVKWKSNALSRVRLTVKRRTPDGLQDVTDPTNPAVAAMGALFGGEQGQAQMLSSLGTCLGTPGEGYLVGVDRSEDGLPDEWAVRTIMEVKENTGYWEVDLGDGEPKRYRMASEEAPGEAIVIRIWNGDPAYSMKATSPVRPALPILRELEGLTQHIGASIDSRLTGAGILVVPAEMTFTPPPTAGDGTAATPDPTAADVDSFIQELAEAMAAAKADRSSPAAHVPIVIKAPGALIPNLKHLTFATPFDAQTQTLREECIRRLALSLDMPPEVLLGQADSNHWSAWLISEDAIKIHVEPDVAAICDAITRHYLWPAITPANLTGPGAEEQSYVIVGDTSALRQRPDKTAVAQALHKDLLISDAALRRETGFDEADEPDSDEIAVRLLRQTANGVTTADVTVSALEALGVYLVPKPAMAEAPPALDTGTAPATPAALPTPAQDAERAIPSQVAALMAACEPILDNVITRARAKAAHGVRLPGAEQPRRFRIGTVIQADAVDVLLTDAFTSVPRTAAYLSVDPDRLTAALSMYARALLETGAPHDPRALHAVITDRVLAPTQRHAALLALEGGRA